MDSLGSAYDPVNERENPYKCGLCDYSSTNDHLVQRHLKNSKLPPEQCQYCDYKSCTRDALFIHRVEIHPTEPSFGQNSQQASVPSTWANVTWRIKKRSRALPISPAEITEPMITDAIKAASAAEDWMYSCNHCNFCSYDAEKFANHILLRRSGTPLRCQVCMFESCTALSMTEHTDEWHSSRSVPKICLNSTGYPMQQELEEETEADPKIEVDETNGDDEMKEIRMNEKDQSKLASQSEHCVGINDGENREIASLGKKQGPYRLMQGPIHVLKDFGKEVDEGLPNGEFYIKKDVHKKIIKMAGVYYYYLYNFGHQENYADVAEQTREAFRGKGKFETRRFRLALRDEIHRLRLTDPGRKNKASAFEECGLGEIQNGLDFPHSLKH